MNAELMGIWHNPVLSQWFWHPALFLFNKCKQAFYIFRLLLQIEQHQMLMTLSAGSFPSEVAGNSGLFRSLELYG